MARYYITKSLDLAFEVEADSASEALMACQTADDQSSEFALIDCQYLVEDEHGNEIAYDEIEGAY